MFVGPSFSSGYKEIVDVVPTASLVKRMTADGVTEPLVAEPGYQLDEAASASGAKTV